MNKIIYVCLAGVLCLPFQALRAQEKPKAEEHAKSATPIKVQIVFTEFDGDKKISSMPYSFMTISDEKMGGNYSTSLRTGVRIPIETDGKDQKTTYMDVGSNIDCGVRSEEDGRFRVFLIFDRSALYPNKSAEGERLVAEPNGLPLVRQFRTSENLILRDGQTSENILSTDPLNGHTLRVSVTISAQK
ncbi:MAG TPA: hypothetical protein VH114_06795 [Candidatus Acidoferrum sp.]|jgi:hypothetical protein|nr:hypothetical protein [Candidatus Acidoferrum sp.]